MAAVLHADQLGDAAEVLLEPFDVGRFGLV
jgi:hypothetical protein